MYMKVIGVLYGLCHPAQGTLGEDGVDAMIEA